MVVDLIWRVRKRDLRVILISHTMPNVFEVADHVHIQRLDQWIAVIKPHELNMLDAVALIIGAMSGEKTTN